MPGFHVALVPVGRVDAAELEAAAARAVKPLRQPLELRRALPLPHGAEDASRGQHRAAQLIALLRAAAVKSAPGRLVGAEEGARPPLRPDAFVFVTDVDLYTAKTAGVLAAFQVAQRAAVISVRRQREAFYRRRADPGKQRARLVKEILRVWGRLQKLAECGDPGCALAPARGVPDIDSKREGYCRDCAQRLFAGKLRL